MPPKKGRGGKRVGASKSGGPAPKISKQDSIKANISAATSALRTDPGSSKSFSKKPLPVQKSRKVDSHCPLGGASVVDDYDCMLNQTNIGFNNNKYYVIQLLKLGAKFYVWNKWGRVGEVRANKLHGPFATMEPAVKEFEKKFQDKTRNVWSNRDNFVTSPGKYTLLDMGEEDEEETVVKSQPGTKSAPVKKRQPSKLAPEVQKLVKLVFDNDMFKSEMEKLNLDLKKLPLGKLSKPQIAKGFDALDEIDDALKSDASTAKLATLSSKFYTIIPHDFGRTVPPVIKTREMLREKLDMLLVLGDIEVAQNLQKSQAQKEQESDKHPLDIQYEMLNCHLEVVKQSAEDFKVLQEFLNNTTSSWHKPSIINIFKMDRAGEDTRFSAHRNVANRKLLWHGTSPAVVAAILKSGLRIMPHSGGRVGRGIYFASENAKSVGYTGRTKDNEGIMFLNEVVLGKTHSITYDNSQLTSPPKGFESVVAEGRTEPDPKGDKKMKFDGKEVVIPAGKPVTRGSFSQSRFYQSEYLVYDESHVKMRYLLYLKF